MLYLGYSETPTGGNVPNQATHPRIRLITRGDDCGSNHTANVAIRAAFEHGILKNTSIMVPCAAVEEAACGCWAAALSTPSSARLSMPMTTH